MPLADLALYQAYTERQGFPGRRVELLLAQVSKLIAQVNGARSVRLQDFLMDPPEHAADPEDPAAHTPADPAAVAAALQFHPRKRPPRTDPNGDPPHGQ